MKVLHCMKTWNICKIRTIYFSPADLWKEKYKKCDGEIIQRCEVGPGPSPVKLLGTNLLVTTVIILNNNGRLRLPGLLLGLGLAEELGGPQGDGETFLPSLVGPVGLLDGLGGLVELPLFSVRQREVGQILLTLGWGLNILTWSLFTGGGDKKYSPLERYIK